MHDTLSHDKLQMFENRLVKVFRHVNKQAKRQHITCYRVYDHDLPEFPMSIDVYEDKLYIAEYRRRHGMDEAAHEQWLDDTLRVVEKILQVPQDNIYVKQRQRKQGRLGQYQKVNEEKEYFTVKEAGLQFRVNLSDYLDTGLFLDHRITREMVRQESKGKRVLNLFAYTGSFSVYAAAGEALLVETVDLSKTYLQWAEENFILNGLSGSQYRFVNADVKQYIQNVSPQSFDLVIMDPPTFSNSKKMKDDFLDVQRDHVALINAAMNSLTDGGVLYFSTNFTKFELNEPAIHCSSIKNITQSTTPFDFAGKLKRYCWRMVK
ncbi:MAG: class I SAM-dependent methyltransferase [Agriterribacter sp.]